MCLAVIGHGPNQLISWNDRSYGTYQQLAGSPTTHSVSQAITYCSNCGVCKLADVSWHCMSSSLTVWVDALLIVYQANPQRMVRSCILNKQQRPAGRAATDLQRDCLTGRA